MFTVMKFPPIPVRVGLDWAVIKTNYAGNASVFAYCKSNGIASKIADAMNSMATVSAFAAE